MRVMWKDIENFQDKNNRFSTKIKRTFMGKNDYS